MKGSEIAAPRHAADKAAESAHAQAVGELGDSGEGQRTRGGGGVTQAFSRLTPNPADREGGILLFSPKNLVFYEITFGSGDNLSAEDSAGGYDGYIVVNTAKLVHGPGIEYLTVEPSDGGDMLVRYDDYGRSGDIRDYLADALDFAGYCGSYDDLVEIRQPAEPITVVLQLGPDDGKAFPHVGSRTAVLHINPDSVDGKDDLPRAIVDELHRAYGIVAERFHPELVSSIRGTPAEWGPVNADDLGKETT